MYERNTEECEQGQCVVYEHYLRTPEDKVLEAMGLWL